MDTGMARCITTVKYSVDSFRRTKTFIRPERSGEPPSLAICKGSCQDKLTFPSAGTCPAQVIGQACPILISSAENSLGSQVERPGEGWGRASWLHTLSSLARTFHRPSGCIQVRMASPLDSRSFKHALKEHPESAKLLQCISRH